jgi:cellulose synthase operon protein YhjQ
MEQPYMNDPLLNEKVSTETPEDVAVLYNWANLQGAQYRDFSASRREYRAQLHRRAAEQRRTQSAEREALEAQIAEREAEQREIELREAARIQAATRQDVNRHSTELQRARADQARAAAAAQEAAFYTQQQPRIYEELRTTTARTAQAPIDTAGSYPSPNAPTKQPAYAPLPSFSAREDSLPTLHNEPALPQAEPLPQFSAFAASIPGFRQAQQTTRQEAARVKPESVSSPIPRPAPQYQPPANVPPVAATPMTAQVPAAAPPRTAVYPSVTASYPAYPSGSPDTRTGTTPVAAVPSGQPEWLTGSYPAANPATGPRPSVTARSPISDTLQYSRERVASRWFALKGIFETPGQEPEAPPVRQKETHVPVLAFFSLAGGVGKTSMVATLGRTLSALGEKTLLLDTTAYGLLPFYFGARELRPNTIRTFAPPSGSTDAPIHMVSLTVEGRTPEAGAPDPLIEDVQRNARGTNRVVMDVSTAAAQLARRIMRLSPIVVVPVAPDMNSVISLNAVEQFFKNQTDGEGRPVKVYYLLNQFDPSQPLHLDVREVLRQQLGDRLLPFVIRRSPAVSEALAEGMTVMDYAPNSPAAEDYLNLANWLRNISAPATAGFRGVRWSEQP